MEKGLYIGQYRSNDKLLKYNQIRYKIYCMILDLLCFSNSLENKTEISRTKIENFIFASIKRNKDNEAIVYTTIGSMLMSGLISEINDNLKLMPLGIKAYREQTYHLVAANLVEAKASRNLSKIAVAISIITMFLTIISLFLVIYHK
jgi:hypothetical protein